VDPVREEDHRVGTNNIERIGVSSSKLASKPVNDSGAELEELDRLWLSAGRCTVQA
jgi:hypothetical protein